MLLDYQNTSFEVKETKPDMAVLPIGATERCGEHLPVGEQHEVVLVRVVVRDVDPVAPAHLLHLVAARRPALEDEGRRVVLPRAADREHVEVGPETPELRAFDGQRLDRRVVPERPPRRVLVEAVGASFH